MTKMLEIEHCETCARHYAGWCAELRRDIAFPVDPDCPLPQMPRWVAVASGELPPLGVDVPVLLGSGRLRNLAIAKREESMLYAGCILWLAGILNVSNLVTYWLRGMPPLPTEEPTLCEHMHIAALCEYCHEEANDATE